MINELFGMAVALMIIGFVLLIFSFVMFIMDKRCGIWLYLSLNTLLVSRAMGQGALLLANPGSKLYAIVFAISLIGVLIGLLFAPRYDYNGRVRTKKSDKCGAKEE